jgi:PAS domain S-box-containing protein
VDYRFLNVNSAFENITGLKETDLIGKTVLEVMPNTEQYWIDTYGQVALTGKSIKFDNYSQEMKKYFEVSAYCPKSGQFVTVFNDITDKKNADAEKDRLIEELRQAVNEIKTLRGILPICSMCKQIRDDQGYWNQFEAYIEAHSDVDFSHSICPDCAQKHYPEMNLYDD